MGTKAQRALFGVAEALEANAAALAGLDSFAGDGDLGVTAQHIASELRALAPAAIDMEPADVLDRAGAAIAEAAPSSFGTLLALGLLSAANEVRGIESEPKDDVQSWHAALHAACQAVAEHGGAVVGQKTVLDAAVPASEALGDGSTTLSNALEASVRAARSGADATADMTAQIGRAGLLSERSSGHVDAGAELFAIAWNALASSVTS